MRILLEFCRQNFVVRRDWNFAKSGIAASLSDSPVWRQNGVDPLIETAKMVTDYVWQLSSLLEWTP